MTAYTRRARIAARRRARLAVLATVQVITSLLVIPALLFAGAGLVEPDDSVFAAGFQQVLAGILAAIVFALIAAWARGYREGLVNRRR